jgi:hypothetical protein
VNRVAGAAAGGPGGVSELAAVVSESRATSKARVRAMVSVRHVMTQAQTVNALARRESLCMSPAAAACQSLI